MTDIAEDYLRLIGDWSDPYPAPVVTMPGAQYQGAIGMRMAVRPNPGTDTFCEPIWVWRKG